MMSRKKKKKKKIDKASVGGIGHGLLETENCYFWCGYLLSLFFFLIESSVILSLGLVAQGPG